MLKKKRQQSKQHNMYYFIEIVLWRGKTEFPLKMHLQIKQRRRKKNIQ